MGWRSSGLRVFDVDRTSYAALLHICLGRSLRTLTLPMRVGRQHKIVENCE